MKEFFKKCVIAVLTLEAQILLKRKQPKIIAITGSVGKTSTKDAVFTVLKNHVHARKSDKSFNSDIGVALTVLGLPNAWNNPFSWIKNMFDGALHAFFPSNYPEVLVLEMGVDRPGDMKRLTSWISPDIVVVTRFSDVPVHVEYFASPEQIIEEKMTLVHALKPNGVFIYNNDDDRIQPYLGDVRQQAFGFSRYSQSHFTASGDIVVYDGASPIGLQFYITHINESEKVQVKGSLGIQNAYSYAAAAAVGSLFDISLKDAAAELSEHVPPAGRMRIIPGIQGSVILDDTYNSSPIACEHAIESLYEIKNSGKKIAVLGDMLELGQYSVREHERMGEFLASKVDILITLGLRSRKIADGALAHGLSEKNIFQYEDVDRAARELKLIVGKGDAVLIKASQGIRAEKIVKALMANPEKAGELLVRNDATWKKL